MTLKKENKITFDIYISSKSEILVIKDSVLFLKFQCSANFKIFLTNEDLEGYIMYCIILSNYD